MYYDILIHTCMKQDQSYFRQVFYLREDNFGLNYKKSITFKISYKIVALFTVQLSFNFAASWNQVKSIDWYYKLCATYVSMI